MINVKYSARKRVLNTLLWIGSGAFGLLITAIAYLPNDKTGLVNHLPPIAAQLIAWVTARAWWIVPLLVCLVAISKVWRERLDHAWQWNLIQDLVDRIARDAFSGVSGANHHHRATLFQHKTWCWRCPYRGSWWWPWGIGRMPWSGWLVPVVRSGYATQNSKSVFLAPDDADKAEGVAGLVWAHDSELVIQTPKAIDRQATEAEINRYSQDTNAPKEWIDKQILAGNTLAASFKGIAVEVKGRRWGVLLLDSREPSAAGNAQLQMSNYAYLLGKLIEGARL